MTEFQITDIEKVKLNSIWEILQNENREDGLPAPTNFCELKWDDAEGEQEQEFTSLPKALAFALDLQSNGAWDCILCDANSEGVRTLY